jgi:hypothetical protein
MEPAPGAVAERLGRGLQAPYSGYVEESAEPAHMHGKRVCQSSTFAMMHSRGAMAEWLGKGLQSPVRRFDSGSRL